MILSTYTEENTEIIFSYRPAWEMFFALHVLAAPEHHGMQREWVRQMEKEHLELVNEIRSLKDGTDHWNFVIDSDWWLSNREKTVPEILDALAKLNIDHWNGYFVCDRGRIDRLRKKQILDVIDRFWSEVYREYEENSRETLIAKILLEAKTCIQIGIWNWCQTVHERLRVEEKEIVFRKNRDFTYPKDEIHRITITISRFVHPHLWLYERKSELEIIKAYTSEPITQGLPEDFLRLFQALGERTRLAIVSELMKEPQSTKKLADRLILTEAAISRHLKILQEAGLVVKHREGKSMIYEFCTDMIDFLPYQFYETMYQGKRRK